MRGGYRGKCFAQKYRNGRKHATQIKAIQLKIHFFAFEPKKNLHFRVKGFLKAPLLFGKKTCDLVVVFQNRSDLDGRWIAD